MKVVATLLARDEADIVGAQIAYHLGAGVDFVIASDHGSSDGTTEILRSYAEQGRLHLVRVEGAVVREREWRTAMARLAAVEYGADWVINTDADEFWVPRYGTLKETLALVPAEYDVVSGSLRHFLPRPEDGRPFFERMTVFLAPPAAVSDPTAPWRPGSKSAHRARPDIVVWDAGLPVGPPGLRRLPGWNLFDVLHFPCRGLEQWTRKTTRRGHAGADKPLAIYVKGLQAAAQGRQEALFRSLALGDEEVARGLELGCLREDTRLREALRSGRLEPQAPPIGEQVQGAVERTLVYDAALVRALRRADAAFERAARVERRSARRLPRPAPGGSEPQAGETLKLAMALIAREEDEEMLEASLAYHLAAGVDQVALGGPAAEAAEGALARYVACGSVALLRRRRGEGEDELRARLRETAVARCRPHWLIESRAHEFWWPRGEGLKQVLAPVPPRYTVVQALVRVFAFGEGEGPFFERMTVREGRPRAAPEALARVYRVRQGRVLGLTDESLVPLRAWYPIEVLSFPPGGWTRQGASAEAWVVDERLRDLLRLLRREEGGGFLLPGEPPSPLALPAPGAVEDALYALDCAAVAEVDLSQVEERLREVERRLALLEQRLSLRVARRLRRLRGRLRQLGAAASWRAR